MKHHTIKQHGERVGYILARPTCDSIDVVNDTIILPKLNNRSLLISRMMGAYTATDFHFFKPAEVVVLNAPVHSQVLTGYWQALVSLAIDTLPWTYISKTAVVYYCGYFIP